MIALVTITPFGFVIIPVFVLSFYLAYRWLKPADKKENAGCFSVGIAGLVIGLGLSFPISITFQFFESGIQGAKIGIIVFWVLFLGLVFYLAKTGKYRQIGSFMLKGFIYVIAPLMVVGMASGMGYFIYLRFFTHEKDDTPLWATILVLFFFVTLLMLPFGLYNQRKQGIQEEKTTFDNLEKAKLRPEFVKDLNLSNTNLPEFPEAILKFINLELLDLSKNQLVTIPDELRRMKNLVAINLEGNPVGTQERIRIRKLFDGIEVIF